MIAQDPAAPADGAQVEGVQRALARIAEIGERLPVGTGFADVLAPHLAPEPFPAPVAPPVTEGLVNGQLDPSQLVAVSGTWTGTGMLLPRAAVAWEAMRREAAADGITLLAVDTYRSRETRAAAPAEYEAGRKDAYVAPPGGEPPRVRARRRPHEQSPHMAGRPGVGVDGCQRSPLRVGTHLDRELALGVSGTRRVGCCTLCPCPPSAPT